jgi:hypothetical protein
VLGSPLANQPPLAALPSISPAGVARRPDVDPGDLSNLAALAGQSLALRPKPATNAERLTKMEVRVNGEGEANFRSLAQEYWRESGLVHTLAEIAAEG